MSASNIGRGLNGKLLREVEFPAVTVNLYEHEDGSKAPRKVHFAGDDVDEDNVYQVNHCLRPACMTWLMWTVTSSEPFCSNVDVTLSFWTDVFRLVI